jgi:hypothetical protein
VTAIRLCTGFPSGWPPAFAERILSSRLERWPVEVLAEPLSQGGGLERNRLIVPAAAASDMTDGDLLAWLDPDIETTASVPRFVIPQLIADADFAMILRTDGSVDPSFWIARLSPNVRPALLAVALYAGEYSGAAEAWRDNLGETLRVRDLTPGRHSDDDWQLGPLGRYTRREPRPE